jgi:hypothetical protein
MDSDRRTYRRDACYLTDAKVSLDGMIWHAATVYDISAGGLKFQSNIMFDKGEDLWFDLAVPEFLSKQEMKVRGELCRQDYENGMFVYGVAFKDLSKDVVIGIDENIILRDRLGKSKKKMECSD